MTTQEIHDWLKKYENTHDQEIVLRTGSARKVLTELIELRSENARLKAEKETFYRIAEDRVAIMNRSASELNSLRAERDRLKAQVAELTVKHDVACRTITNMQREREQRLSYQVLSSLSLWLSQGMGDGSTTAEQYEQRIRDGVNLMISVETERRERAQADSEALRKRVEELEKERDVWMNWMNCFKLTEPETAALRSRLADAQAEIVRLRGRHPCEPLLSTVEACNVRLGAEVKGFRARLAETEKDRDRLDWLDEQRIEGTTMALPRWYWELYPPPCSVCSLQHRGIRSAIDAARASAQEGEK